jgi:hypothetical protein
MPLLVSPIDGSPMRQIVRNGVELDICPTSGGVWLDKGELEKLLAFVHEAVREDDYEDFRQAKRHKRIAVDEYKSYPRPPAYDDDYEDYYKYKYAKKSKLKTFLDIFD